MVKALTCVAALGALASVASLATASPNNNIDQREDLAYLFQAPAAAADAASDALPAPAAHKSFLKRHAARFMKRQHKSGGHSSSSSSSSSSSGSSGSSSAATGTPGNIIPAVGGISLNGMPYPDPSLRAIPRSALPKAWIARYNQKKQAGLIPDIPPTKINNDTQMPEYPAGTSRKDACNWTLDNCNDGDIWLTPDGMTAITFDDGPTPQSPGLAKFLADNQQSASHFLIGSAIMYNGQALKDMVATHSLAHLGCHTFTHTLQTTKTDLEIVGDLGWCAQLIYEVTGLVPAYFRAPEGDVDKRVRAIAKEVLGQQSSMWNRDDDDWCMDEQGHGIETIEKCKTQSYAKVVATYKGWAGNASLPGTNTLMHEVRPSTVNAFKEYYAALKQSKYKMGAMPALIGAPWYQNQFAPTDPVEKVTSILPTRQAITYTDGGLHAVGAAGGPELGDFATLKAASGNGGGSSGTGAAGAGSAAGAAGTSANAGLQSGSGATGGSSSTATGGSSAAGRVAVSAPALSMLTAGAALAVAALL